MDNYNKELEEILALAEATRQRMEDEQARRLEAGHGRGDADEDDLLAFFELGNDLQNLRGALHCLRQCKVSAQAQRKYWDQHYAEARRGH